MKVGFSSYARVYGLLWRSYGQDWHVRVSFVTALISRTCKFIALPIIASQLIAALAIGNYPRARLLVLSFTFFSAMIGILAPLTRYIALLGENTVYARMMNTYFRSLLAMDTKHFNESMTGYLTAATRQYSDNTLQMLRKLRISYLTSVFSLVAPIAVIWYVDSLLGVVVLVMSLIEAGFLLWGSKKIDIYRAKSREKYRYVSGLISDAITNITAVKSTAQEIPIANNMGRHMREESLLFIDRYKAQVKLVAVREIITVSFFLSLFWIAVGRMNSGAVGLAAVVLIVTYSFTILSAIYELTDAVDEHDDFVDKILPALDLLDQTNAVSDPKRPKSLGKIKGEIRFQDVDFAYHEQNTAIPVFKKLKLYIPAGQKVGVVGLSGAGKSTMTKLLLRFEDIQSGSITVDGTDIREVKQAELRRNIAYVPQEPLLFHSSIAENIRLSKLDASDAELKKAARIAHALTFISALPSRFDSVVGERGVKLSGGQKQRIAIARAVLQNAPVMVLDEATSALDSESEQIIKASFKDILQNKTAIVVAHRLSTLSDMDRIVLLEDGVIVEDGTHKQLLKKNKLYAKLWRHQQQRPEDLETVDVRLKNL